MRLALLRAVLASERQDLRVVLHYGITVGLLTLVVPVAAQAVGKVVSLPLKPRGCLPSEGAGEELRPERPPHHAGTRP
jgi:hypothetical protein